MTRRGNHLPLRQLLVIFTSLLLCLSVFPPLPTLAQADLATPIAPANPEADADESLGTQSVAFARFEQSSTTAAAGGTVDMTLFITSTVQETTSGTFTIPAPANLTYAVTGTNRTENMTACAAGADDSGGITGSYTINIGSGVCSVDFTVQIGDVAPGPQTISATILENDIESGSATTTIDIIASSVSARFGQDVYVITPGELYRASLVITIAGPITNGSVTISLPESPDGISLSQAFGSFPTDQQGECEPVVTNAWTITGTFSTIEQGTRITCEISFDIVSTAASASGNHDLVATFSANESSPGTTSSLVTNLVGAAPTVTFKPALFELSPNGSMRAAVRLTFPWTSNPISLIIESDVAGITDPDIVSQYNLEGIGGVPVWTGVDGACSVGQSDGNVTVTIVPQQRSPGICEVNFTVTMLSGIGPGTYSISASSFNPDLQVSATILVSEGNAQGITAAFDQDTYTGVYDDSVPSPFVPYFVVTGTLNITVPAGVPVGTGTFVISSGALIAFENPSASGGPGGTCALDSAIPIGSTTVWGTFTSTGASDFTCSITVPGHVAMTRDRLIATVGTEYGPVLPNPGAVIEFGEYPFVPLMIGLEPSIAAPGDEVEVLITLTEFAPLFVVPNTIRITLPDGVSLVTDSVDLQDCPDIPCTVITGNTITAQHFSPFPVGQVFLRFRVMVDAPAGSTISFNAQASSTAGVELYAGPRTLRVQGAAPIASDFNLVVEAGSSVSGTLADHLSSENGIDSYASDAPTGPGNFTLDPATGAFTYTANSTVGTDSIAYTVTDVADLSGTGTINVTIVEPLKAPTIHLDRIWNESIALNLQTFIDGGQAPHTFTPASGQLTYGSYTIDATGLLTYIPNGDAAGMDTFSFEVTDGLGLPQSEVTSAAVITGTIIVTVWEPASASPVTLNLAPGGHTTIDLHTLATGGLAPLGFNLLSFPAQADAQLDPNTGMLTITVNDDASGTESFDFQVYFSFHNSIGLYSAADTDPYYPTGTITLNYIPPPTPTATATATSPSDPTATATAPASATATPPSDVTATATSPADPTATATSPAGLVATATSPGSGGDPAGGNGNGNQDGSAPGTSNTGSSPGDQTGGSSGVTQLPSTGSAGERPANPSGIWMLLLLAFIIVSTAALRRHQCR